MTELIEFIRIFAETIVQSMGAGGVAILLFLEIIIPTQFVLPMAGFLVSQGGLSLFEVIIASTLGAVASSCSLFFLGFRLGEWRVRRLINHYGRFLLLTEKDFDRALNFFRRFDKHVLFWGRLIPAVRVMIAVPAGVSKIAIVRFLLYIVFATLLWNTVFIMLGFVLEQNWQRVLAMVDRYELILWIVIAGFVLYWMWRRLPRVLSKDKARKD